MTSADDDYRRARSENQRQAEEPNKNRLCPRDHNWRSRSWVFGEFFFNKKRVRSFLKIRQVRLNDGIIPTRKQQLRNSVLRHHLIMNSQRKMTSSLIADSNSANAKYDENSRRISCWNAVNGQGRYSWIWAEIKTWKINYELALNCETFRAKVQPETYFNSAGICSSSDLFWLYLFFNII